jgi:hypothetical protein
MGDVQASDNRYAVYLSMNLGMHGQFGDLAAARAITRNCSCVRERPQRSVNVAGWT